MPDTSFGPSRTAQTVEFLLDNQALLNKQLQWPITNKSQRLRYDQNTLHVLAAELYPIGHGFNIIEKQH